VDVVFQGYNRNYERTKPIKNGVADEAGGIVYVTLGGGGRALNMQARNEAWSDKFIPAYHFAYSEVSENKFRMSVYDKDGVVLDEFELEK